jgi:hypothetical protein
MSTAVNAPVFTVTDATQKLLKNFSSISDSVLLVEGKKQKTVLQSRAVFAIAEFPEAWPRETGIFKLGEFVGVLSSFDKPVIEFNDVAMNIHSATGRGDVDYGYSDPSTIQAIADRMIPKDNPACEFILSSQDLTQLKRQASALSLTAFTVTVKGGKVNIVAKDPKNPRSNGYKTTIDQVTMHNKTFDRTLLFKVEHLPMLMDGNYVVALSDWRYAYLTNQDAPVTYYITEQTKDKD